MFMGTLFFIIVGALYILFAFREPPEAIAPFIQAPLDLQTGACSDMEHGWLGWSGNVPLMY